MTDEQAKELFTMITIAYPSFLNADNKTYSTNEKARFWRSELLAMQYSRTKDRLVKYIRSSPYEPRISDVAAYERTAVKDWREQLKEDGVM